MTERSVRHAKFTIERIYPAARERVFKALRRSPVQGEVVRRSRQLGQVEPHSWTSVSAARKP